MRPQTFVPPGDLFRATRLAQETTRLDLLADIDATIDVLTERVRSFREIASVFSELEVYIAALPVTKGNYVDPEYRALSVFEAAETALKDYISEMTVKRIGIDRDAQLAPDHRESLHDAYEEAITTAALFYEAVQAARGAIIRHDLAAEPRDELPVFDTVEALIADLHHGS
jgi:hypothetical protein